MGLSITQEVTTEFNAGSGYVADASGWDYLVWQFVGPSGTINLTATNDGGAVTGSTEGNSVTATNFVTVQGTKLSDGTAVTVASAGLIRVGVVGRFVRFAGTTVSATKVIIEFFKIS